MIHVYNPAGFLSYSSHLSYKYTVGVLWGSSRQCVFLWESPRPCICNVSLGACPDLGPEREGGAKDLSPSQQGWSGVGVPDLRGRPKPHVWKVAERPGCLPQGTNLRD